MYISYSALDNWVKCPYQFKLKYIDKISYDRGSLHTVFGHSVHKTIETALSYDTEIDFEKIFKAQWQKEIKELPESVKTKIVTSKELKEIAKSMTMSGGKLSKMAIEELKNKFPDFKIIGIEQTIIEPLVEYEPNDYEFKAIIDIIIKTPDGKYHILDWKTTSWGWKIEKKNSKMVTYQLTYYKHFLSLQKDLNITDIKTYFALVKRTAKKDNIEIFEVPIGERKIKNALKVLNNMLYNIDKQNFPKNKTSCEWCDFHHTQWCNAK